MDTGYQFGSEEEFFPADASTRGMARRRMRAFDRDVHKQLPSVECELLEAQVEIASPPSISSSWHLGGATDDAGDLQYRLHQAEFLRFVRLDVPV